jgi:hypothetical protein
VISYGYYHIVGDSLVHDSQETILMAGIASFVVKTMKQELKVDNVLPECFDALASFTFIGLSDSFAGEDLTPFPSVKG